MPRRFEFIAEDWRKEYEKLVLTRKYSRASSLIGYALSFPDLLNIKLAFAAVVDFVSDIPIPENSKHKEERDNFLKELDEIGLILYGNYEREDVKKLLEKYGLFVKRVRDGVKLVPQLQNLPLLAIKLREILVKAGDFATSRGLRITLAKPVKRGARRILEEEGLEDIEV